VLINYKKIFLKLASKRQILKAIISHCRHKKEMEEVNKVLLIQYRLISLQNLTTLIDKDHDVEKWYNDLISWFRVQNLILKKNLIYL